jgi:hypothetical protein
MTLFTEWRAGEIVTADKMNDKTIPGHVVAQVDQQVVNSTTVVNSSWLMFDVEAGQRYSWEAYLGVSGHADGNFKWRWSVPPGGHFFRHTVSNINEIGSGVNASGDVIMRRPARSTEIRAGTSGEGAFRAAVDVGHVLVGRQSGRIVLQFAQFTSHATATVLHFDSFLTYWRID